MLPNGLTYVFCHRSKRSGCYDTATGTYAFGDLHAPTLTDLIGTSTLPAARQHDALDRMILITFTVAGVLFCMAIAICLLGDWTVHVTATSRSAHGIWRGSLPYVDFGVDVYPPKLGTGGYVELWAWPTDIDVDGVVLLVRLPCAPPRPFPPLPRHYHYA